MMIVGSLATAAVIAAMVIAPRSARGTATRLNPGECFRQSEVRNWTAPDDKTLYLRTQLGRTYRVELGNRCMGLTMHSSHLITRSTGTDLVCGPVDYNLSVSDSAGGIPEPCFVQGITMLTPDEAKALPKGAKP
jgi:hypothetical protein